MKKIVLLLAIAFLGTTVSNAQVVKAAKKEVKKVVDTKKAALTKAVNVKAVTSKTAVSDVKKMTGTQVEGAGMVFDQETIDYGTIEHNAPGEREFVLTNNGNKPLIISATQGSCGCTVPTKPEKPILPGGKDVIKVKYATDRVGAFTKTVTVTSNAEGMPSKVLTIKGTVLPDPAAAIPAAPATGAPAATKM